MTLTRQTARQTDSALAAGLPGGGRQAAGDGLAAGDQGAGPAPARLRRMALAVAAALALGLALFGLWRVVVAAELERQATRGAERAALMTASLSAALDRYQHLPFVLARDPFVIRAAAGTGGPGAIDRLNARLADFAAASGAEALYLMDPTGLTIAASNAGGPGSFLGQNYGFRSYFRAAMAGASGELYAVGATTGLAGYFLSRGVRAPSGDVAGVLAVKVQLRDLEASWAEGGERVLVVNEDGVVVLGSEPAWRFRTLGPIPPERRRRIAAERQFREETLIPLDAAFPEPGRLRIEGARYIASSREVGRMGWVLYHLAPVEPVNDRARLAAAGALTLAALGLALWLFWRGRQTGRALSSAVEARDTLARLNAALEAEIDERRRAEAELRRTQAELGRASRLAALGQLSASVSHEISQPLAAMKTHLAGASLPGTPADPETRETFDALGALVERMHRLTRQLKFFARSSDEAMTDVDLAAAVAGALAVMRPAIAEQGTALDVAAAPGAVVRGDQLRLEQVLVNLLRNALDAVTEGGAGADGRIAVTLRAGSGEAVLTVADTGPGLEPGQADEIFEPFHSTKPSGQGMGLGLAISAGIVTDHGGQIAAANGPEGGAVFTVTLPLAAPPAGTGAKEEQGAGGAA